MIPILAKANARLVKSDEQASELKAVGRQGAQPMILCYLTTRPKASCALAVFDTNCVDRWHTCHAR